MAAVIDPGAKVRQAYTLFHRGCGHPHHLCYATLQTSRCFRPQRAVGFDRAFRLRRDRIQLPVGVENISKFAKLHDKGDEGVHTLDGTEYIALKVVPYIVMLTNIPQRNRRDT